MRLTFLRVFWGGIYELLLRDTEVFTAQSIAILGIPVFLAFGYIIWSAVYWRPRTELPTKTNEGTTYDLNLQVLCIGCYEFTIKALISVIWIIYQTNSWNLKITEYLYRIILSYLSPSCTFIYRVGAIYALYGVYHTQLCNPKIKIRMTLLMWNNLKELHEELIYLKHHDADFIIRSLRNVKAFLFCALSTKIAYGSRDAISSKAGELTAAIVLEADQVIDKTCGMLERIHEIHNKYQNTKDKIFDFKKTSFNKRTLDVVHTGIAVDIARDIEHFDKWKQNRCLKHVLSQRKSAILMIPDDNFQRDRPTMDKITQHTLTESAARAKLLDNIKKRSFSQVGKVSRSMRHLKPTAAEDDAKRQKDKE